MLLATDSLFSFAYRRKFGLSPNSPFDKNANLIEKLGTTSQQSHSLSDQYDQPTSPNAAYYSQDNSGLIAVGDEDGNAHIYDTLSNKFLIAWNPHRSAILDLVWVPTVPKIITCSADRSIVVSDSVKHQIELSFSGHTKSVRCLDLCLDHPTTFASGGRDGRVLIWDIRYPRRDCCGYHSINSIAPFIKESFDNKRQIHITSVKFLSDKMLATSGDASHLIKIWDIRRTYTNYKRVPLPWHTVCPKFELSVNRGYTCMTVDKSCSSIFASGLDGYIRRFSTNFNTNNELDNYYGHKANNFYIRNCLSPNGHWLLSGSMCGKAHLWDVTKPGSHLYTLGCVSSSEILAVAWSPVDIDNLATCSDECIAFWNMNRRSTMDSNSMYYQVEKVQRRVEWLQGLESERGSKRLKTSTLDRYYLKKSQPGSLNNEQLRETDKSSGSEEVKTEPQDNLNESRTTSNMIESMQNLAVQTDKQVPLNSLTGTERQISISSFLVTGKGVKRKHSVDDMDIHN